MKNGGWFYKADGAQPRRREIPYTPEPTIHIDADKLWRDWAYLTHPARIKELAGILGVKETALAALGCVWAAEKNAWGFPMRKPDGKICGIRLRTLAGDQFAVKGSHAGLFLSDMDAKPILTICEGVSDASAAISMGLWAIGRHNCAGQHDEINEFIKLNRVRRVCVIADNDEDKERPDGTKYNPGFDGAERLQETLKVPSVVILPFLKDLRASFLAGMTAVDLQNLCKEKIWTMPK
jgi:hypothetical protein